MRVRLNVKLLLATILGLTLASIGVHFLHGYQIKRNASTLLRQADLAIEQAQVQKDPLLRQKMLEQGITLMDWYLTFEPRDKETLAKKALLLEKQARTSAARLQATLALEEALRADPGRDDVRFRLVHALVQPGQRHRLPTAIEHMKTLRPGWKQPGEIEHMLGWCYEARGDYAQAAEWLRAAIARSPDRLQSYVILAEILRNRLDQGDEADMIMDQMVKANANWYQAYLDRAHYRQGSGQGEGADEDIAHAVKLAPDKLEVLLAAAEAAKARGDWQKARDLVERGLLLHPQQPSLYKALATLELRTGRRKNALAVLQRGIEKIPQAKVLLVSLADLLIDEGNLEQAKQHIAELQKENFPRALPDYLQARLLMADKKWEPAVRLLERCRVELGPASEWSGRVDYQLGKCYGRLGDVEQQLAAYNRAVTREPSSTVYRIGLGSALLAAGFADEALAQFHSLEQAPDVPEELWSLLAKALMRRNWRQPAWQRDWTAVNKAIEKVAKVRPHSTDVALLRSEALFAEGKTDEAEKLLASACDRKADDAILWTARSELAMRQKKWSEATRFLDEAQKRFGDTMEIRLARIRLWAQHGGPGARPVLAALGDARGLAADDRIILQRVLAETWFRLGDFQAAQTLWQGLAKELPHDLRSRFALFELALKKSELPAATAWWHEIKQLDGSAGMLTQYGEAALALSRARKGDKSTLAEAHRTVAAVARQKAEWPQVQLLQARLAELEGNGDQAVDHYLRAVELGERQPRLARRLIEALSARKRYGEADQVLRWLEENGPLDNELSTLGAEIALLNHDAPRALSLARQAASPDSRDYRQLLWLARILDASEEEAAAEKALRRAVSLAGHNPDTWIALIQHLARKGRAADADAALDQARQKLPADRRDLTLARGLEALGRLDQAEELFAKTVASGPDAFIALENLAQFYLRADRPEKAEASLRKLLDPAVAAPADFAIAARRALALILAARGSSRDQIEARDLLDQNERMLGENVGDERARAVVLAAQPEQRRQALQLFEQTLPRQGLTSVEHLWLVDLYQQAQEYEKARDWLLAMLVQQPDNPQFLARYVRILLAQEQAAEAEHILRKLERIEPISRRSQQLKAEVAKARARM